MQNSSRFLLRGVNPIEAGRATEFSSAFEDGAVQGGRGGSASDELQRRRRNASFQGQGASPIGAQPVARTWPSRRNRVNHRLNIRLQCPAWVFNLVEQNGGVRDVFWGENRHEC
jgi:hypothetical protein